MFASSIILSALAGLAAASPAERSAASTLAARDNWGTCSTGNEFWDYTWQITLSNGQDGGLCQGFLDNLHGSCGLGITNWACSNTNGTTQIGFTGPTTCNKNNVQNVIWVATSPHIEGVQCP